MNIVHPRSSWSAFRAFGVLAAVGVAAAFFTGCSTPGRRGPEAREPALTQAVLRDEARFFDDALLARATLQPLVLSGLGGAAGVGGGRRPGGPGGPGGFGGGPGGGEEMERPAMGLRGPIAGPPRVTLHVSFENRSRETIEFSVRDVISALGNFAIRPERLALAPGQTGAIDGMSSSEPMIYKELAVELRVRRGTASETKTLRLVAPGAAAATSQP